MTPYWGVFTLESGGIFIYSSEVSLVQIELDLPLLAFLVMIIMRILLRGFVHLYILQENAVLLKLGQLLVLLLYVLDLELRLLHVPEGIGGIFRFVNSLSVFLSNHQFFDDVFLGVPFSLGMRILVAGGLARTLQGRAPTVIGTQGRRTLVLLHHVITLFSSLLRPLEEPDIEFLMKVEWLLILAEGINRLFIMNLGQMDTLLKFIHLLFEGKFLFHAAAGRL